MIPANVTQFQRFGLPVAVAGQACLCAVHEARRYHAEFVALPGAL